MSLRGEGDTQPVLVERINNVACDVTELKTDLKDFVREQREREENRIKYEKERDTRISVIENQAAAAHKRLDVVEEWRKSVEKLMPLLRVEAWLIAAISVPVIGWVLYVVGEWARAKLTGVIP